jgi:CubicO group peptidase (beta-lactamase class C family)
MNLQLKIPLRLPAALVTSRSRAELPAREAGLRQEDVEAIWRATEALYDTGLNPAVSLTIRRHGALVLDRSIGHARGNAPGDPIDGPKVRATPDTPICIFSASKAITAVIIHLLDDRGLLHVDDRVSEYIPEFAANGKEWVTLRHVLTHRAGLPSLRAEDGLGLLAHPDAIVRMLCDTAPESAPGRRLAYHAITGGFILGEVVRRVTGVDLRTFFHREFLTPLGLTDLDYGWPADRLDEVAQNAFTGFPVRFPVDRLAYKAIGIRYEDAAAVSNTREWLTSVVPSGNIVGTGAAVTRLFELLRLEGQLDGVRIFSPRTIRRAIVETSHLEIDFTMMLPIRYGVGFMLGANWISVFGPHTPRAFGHMGLSNIFCWCDPARATSVALLTTGKPVLSDHLPHLARLMYTISSRIPDAS